MADTCERKSTLYLTVCLNVVWKYLSNTSQVVSTIEYPTEGIAEKPMPCGKNPLRLEPQCVGSPTETIDQPYPIGC